MSSFDYVSAVDQVTGGDWGMFGNDRYGVCVECDTAHALMLRTANAGTMVAPTTAQVQQLYSDVTGFE